METAAATKFARMTGSTLGPGATIEYKTTGLGASTLAYIDYTADGTRASCTLFTPASGGERRYAERPAGRAFQIVMNHLRRQGWQAPDVDDIEDGTWGGQALREDLAAAQLAVETPEDLRLQLPVDDVDAAEWVRDGLPIAAGTMGPFPAPPVPVNIPYQPATTAPAPPAADETAGEWQQRVQEHFNSVADAADAILGEPADDIVRHWISSRGVIFQLHLRAIVPASETADALRQFVAADGTGIDYTRSADGRILLWSGHAWNCGYAVVLPA